MRILSVHRKLSVLGKCPYREVRLCLVGERHCESKVSCPRSRRERTIHEVTTRKRDPEKVLMTIVSDWCSPHSISRSPNSITTT